MGPCVTVVLLLCLSPVAAGDMQEDRQKALDLWERAVAAKGGRARLAGFRASRFGKEPISIGSCSGTLLAANSIRSCLSCRTTCGSFSTIGLERWGIRYACWTYERVWAGRLMVVPRARSCDQTPTLHIGSVSWDNVYFLETRWVQPTPVRCLAWSTRVEVGRSPGDADR